MKATLAALLCILCALLILQSNAFGQDPQSTRELTIEDIFQNGGILGHGPETVEWSPDGTKVSYVQRDESGQQGTLYFVDTTTGRRAVLVAAEKLSTLAPPATAIKDERKKEAAQRYSIAGYHWAPDSQKLLFDSQGQLWLFSLESGTAVQVTSDSEGAVDPKFSPDGNRIAYVRKHNLYVRPLSGGSEKAAH